MALKPAGDERLGRLIAMLRSLGDDSTRAQVAQKMGATMLRLVNQQIENQVDPYGRPWPPRVDDNAPALLGLRNAFTATFDGRGPRIGTSKWYASVHQNGAKIEAKNVANLKFRLPSGRFVSKPSVTIPRRQIVPTPRTGGLGPTWGPALQRDADNFFREYLRRR